MCEKYLIFFHKNDLTSILENQDITKNYAIHINFLELFENNPKLGNAILTEPDKSLCEWNKAVVQAQVNIQTVNDRFVIKSHVTCRIYGLPVCPELHRTKFPSNEDADKFLQVSGTVIRTTVSKMLEYQRKYICTKCKYPQILKAEYDRKNIIVPPKRCKNPEDCKSTHLVTFNELDTDNCKDYQEIKIQEQVSKLGIGTIANSMWVTLEDDLVDICKPGDSITVCGVVKRRWGQFIVGKMIDIDLVIRANHVQVNNANGNFSKVTPEMKTIFQNYWEKYSHDPLVGRDIILKSICPQIYGMCLVKLAIAVVLAGGSYIGDVSSTGVKIRSEPHLLLVGDPGTGKSQLLRFASKIIPRSVLTTGVGSTAAGLTVTAVLESGEWQLEAGALVMADGGICCIDEFNSMKEHDRISIHEAMEQQTISVAKAGIVCKLSTRCSILAACNPKGNLDRNQPLSLNIAMASPLLSRFDLVLLLPDRINEEWDSMLADYILNGKSNISKLTENVTWNLDMLQSYFITIKKLNPTLTDDANIILSHYYQFQRRVDNRNKSRTTVRLLDSLVRLSQGHARVMFHKNVEIIDALHAVALVDMSMEDGSILNLTIDTHSLFPENPLQNYLEVAQCILTKLNLLEVLNKEILNCKRDNQTHGMSSHPTTVSRFFNKKKSSNNNCPEKINIHEEASTSRGNNNTNLELELKCDGRQEKLRSEDNEITENICIQEKVSASKLIETNEDKCRRKMDIKREKTIHRFKKKTDLKIFNHLSGASDFSDFNIEELPNDLHSTPFDSRDQNNQSKNKFVQHQKGSENSPHKENKNMEDLGIKKAKFSKSTVPKKGKASNRNVLNDLELINLLPSVNDIENFEIEDDYNRNLSAEIVGRHIVTENNTNVAIAANNIPNRENDGFSNSNKGRVNYNSENNELIKLPLKSDKKSIKELFGFILKTEPPKEDDNRGLKNKSDSAISSSPFYLQNQEIDNLDLDL